MNYESPSKPTTKEKVIEYKDSARTLQLIDKIAKKNKTRGKVRVHRTLGTCSAKHKTIRNKVHKQPRQVTR